jgi:hypothetical protein
VAIGNGGHDFFGGGRDGILEVDVMAKSFWEKLGQGLNRGLEKAKVVGASIGEEAEKHLDVGAARRKLRAAYETLGEICAGVRLDEAEEADLEATLRDVVTARERVASAERAAQPQEEASESAPDEDDSDPVSS